MESYYEEKRRKLAAISKQAERGERIEHAVNTFMLALGCITLVLTVLAFTVGIGYITYTFL